MVNVINNNLWSPIPWGFGCGGGCNGNNWMNNMLKYQFMFSLMNNWQNMFRCYVTPPQQQMYNPYGMMGLQLGGGVGMPQTYASYLQQQMYAPYGMMGLQLGGGGGMTPEDAQDLAELKNTYTEFKITGVGGEYQAILKNDRTVHLTGSTPIELMDAMNEYIDANPDKFRAKPASRVENDGEADQAATRTEGAGAPADADDAPAGGAVQQGAAGGNTPVQQRRGAIPPEGWHHKINQTWITLNFTDKNITTPTAEQIAMAFNGNGKLNMSGMSAENKAKLIADLIKYNYSCFNSDGTGKSPFPWDKLDIPGPSLLKNTYAVPEKTTQQAAATTKPDKSKHYIVRMTMKGTTSDISKAFAVTPDGQTITLTQNDFSIDPHNSSTYYVSAQQMEDEMKKRLQQAGFKNVTIRSDGYNINKGATSTDFNADDKKRHYVVTLQCDNSGDRIVYGCYLPDGTFMTITNYQVSAGPNLDNIVRGQAKQFYGWENITCNWDPDTFRTS